MLLTFCAKSYHRYPLSVNYFDWSKWPLSWNSNKRLTVCHYRFVVNFQWPAKTNLCYPFLLNDWRLAWNDILEIIGLLFKVNGSLVISSNLPIMLALSVFANRFKFKDLPISGNYGLTVSKLLVHRLFPES